LSEGERFCKGCYLLLCALTDIYVTERKFAEFKLDIIGTFLKDLTVSNPALAREYI
jgi:hypothetical protein